VSVTNFAIVSRAVTLGDKMIPPMGDDEAQGKPVRARGRISFHGAGGETIWVLFLTEYSAVPPATTFAVPPTCMLYLPHLLLDSWLATLQVASPKVGQINFDDHEETFVHFE
jgi:hypothetical protein